KAKADYSQDGYSITNVISGIATNAGWATSAAEEKGRVERSAWFTVSKATEFGEGTSITITLRHNSKWPEANLGRFRLSVTAMDKVEPPPKMPEKVRAILASAEKPSEKDASELDKHFRTVAPELKKVRDTIADVKKQQGELENAIARTPVME